MQTKYIYKMKKIILSLLLLFISLMANALTVDKLLNYYKNQPDANYEVTKGKRLKALVDSVSTDVEKDALRSAKKLVVVNSFMDEKQRDELSSKLNILDDYSLAFSYSMNNPEPTIPLLFTATGIEYSMTVDIYAKNSFSNEYIYQPIFIIKVNEMVALAYLDGKIKPEVAKDFIKVTFNTDYPDSASAQKKSHLDRIDIQRNIYPQEKLHVVTDRDIYCGGDTVWFRIFVVDAASHQQTSMSKYAYVELLNPFGKVQNRIKVMEREGIYTGFLPLTTDTYEGDYTLAAYTAYSENQGEDYFFKKPLKLLSLHSDQYSLSADFSSKGDSIIKGNIKLTNSDGHNIQVGKISYTLPNGEYFETLKGKSFKRTFNLQNSEDVVLVKHGDFGKFISIENQDDNSINLDFYPEGGWLIEGVPCQVAFKATDSNGKGIDLSGIIYDNNGKKISEFNSSHYGMGSVIFIPDAGKSYFAEYVDSNLKKHTVEIGQPKEGATSLRYYSAGPKCIFSIAGGKREPYDLVVACRGKGLFSIPISRSQPITVDKSELPTGLYQAFIISPANNHVVSERLFFIGADRPFNMPKTASLSNDSTKINLISAIENPADCSVRIVKDGMNAEDNSVNIVSQLLLQGELRGRIENPGYYFKNPNRETEHNLDLLMMVNGWSRYNLPEAILGNYTEPEIPIEIGQEISGQVLSRWKNKPLEGIMIYSIAPKENFGIFAETDNDGIFRLNGFDLPENTPFIFRAMNEKGDNEINYEIFEDHFPSVEILNDTISSNRRINSDLLASNKWKLLDEVNVTAMSLSGAEIYGYDLYGSLASYSCNSTDMKAKNISSIEEAMHSLPGISTIMGYLKWRNEYVAYYLDGRIFEPSSGSGKGATVAELNSLIPFESIERIDFVRPEHASVLGRTYGGGAIMIITKKGDKTGWQKQFELKDYLPLGYQQYKEYASPILSEDFKEYEMQTHPTLLWLPSVKFDEHGKAIDLKFPLKSDYRLIIEGITDNGDIISETL